MTTPTLWAKVYITNSTLDTKSLQALQHQIKCSRSAPLDVCVDLYEAFDGFGSQITSITLASWKGISLIMREILPRCRTLVIPWELHTNGESFFPPGIHIQMPLLELISASNLFHPSVVVDAPRLKTAYLTGSLESSGIHQLSHSPAASFTHLSVGNFAASVETLTSICMRHPGLIQCEFDLINVLPSSSQRSTIFMLAMRSLKIQWIPFDSSADDAVGSFLDVINAPMLDDLTLIAIPLRQKSVSPLQFILRNPYWIPVIKQLRKLSLWDQNLAAVNFACTVLSQCDQLQELRLQKCTGLDLAIEFYAEKVDGETYRLQTLPLHTLHISSLFERPLDKWRAPLVAMIVAGIEHGALKDIKLDTAQFLTYEDFKTLEKFK